MKITEVAYSRSQTLQIRAYEPTNVFMSAKAEVGEGDDPKKVYAELKAIVDGELEITVKILQEPHKVAYQASKTLVNKDAKKEVSPF